MTNDCRRTSRHGAALALFLCAAFMWPAAARSETMIKVFSLESVRTEKKHGPFQYLQGAPVKIEEKQFKVTIENRKSFGFVSVDTRQSFGPYDLIEGRIIRIGKELFTLIEIRNMAYTPPGKPAEPKANKAADPVVPVPPRRPPVKKSADTRVVPSGIKVQPAAVTPAPGSGLRRTTWLDGSPLEVGVSLGLFRATEYEWKIDGASDGADATFNRNAVSFHLKKGWLSLNAGFTLDSRSDESIDGDGISFREVDIDNGQGWWLGLGADIPVWRNGPWQANVMGDVYHMSEEYKVGYLAWTETSTVIQPGGTNGTEETVQTYDLRNMDEDITITETLARIGGKLQYSRGNWSCFGGIRIIVFDDVEASDGIRVSSNTYDMSLERTGMASIVGGASLERLGLKWFAEGEAGADLALTVGVLRTF